MTGFFEKCNEHSSSIKKNWKLRDESNNSYFRKTSLVHILGYLLTLWDDCNDFPPKSARTQDYSLVLSKNSKNIA